MTTYWARARVGRRYVDYGPYATREDAIKRGWEFTQHYYPPVKEISTGYGSEGAYFDIRWHRREEDT